MPFFRDPPAHVAGQIAADEVAFGTLRCEGIGEGKTAHDVAGPDLERSVGAESEDLSIVHTRAQI